MKLVVDTSILIDHLRGGLIWKNIIDQIEQENAKLFIPTIVIFELFSGKSTQNSKKVEEVEKLIKSFQQMKLTEKIAKHAGEIYRDVTHELDIPDYIIGASALEIGATVVTLNKKHFNKIPGIDLYPL